MRKNLFLTTILIIAFFAACNKEVSNNNNFFTYLGNALNDTNWVQNIPAAAPVHDLSDSTAPTYFEDYIEATKSDTLNINANLQLIFPANACVNSSGGTIIGKLKVEVVRLESKGAFVGAVKSTTSSGTILESEGSFFIRVTQNGKEVRLSPTASYTIRFTTKSNDVKPNMQLYYGVETIPFISNGIDAAFSWVTTSSNAAQLYYYSKPIIGAADQRGYEIKAKNFRWISIARALESSLKKGKLSMILPLNFTNKNTLTFALLLEHNTVVQLSGDFNSRTFAALNIPTTKKIKVVTVSLIGNIYYYSETDISSLGNTAAFKAKPEKKPLTAILAVLKNL